VRITVAGSIHMDFYINLPRLPVPGETVLGKGFTMLPGGKGANQAVGCARLGAYTYMVSRVGKDFMGEELLKNLRENGVDTRYIRVDEETHTGVAFILLDESSGENMIAVAPGTDYRVSVEDVDNSMKAIEESDVLLLQLEIPVETVYYAAKKAWEKGVKVVLNPAPARELPSDIYRYLYALTPNRVEASLLSGVEVKTIDDAVKAGRELVSRGVEYVVITLGREGSLIVSRDMAKHVPAFKVKAVDTTGAGDAFNAALAVAIAEARDMVEACRIANAAAAIQITRLGAQSGLPSREELEEFLAKHSS